MGKKFDIMNIPDGTKGDWSIKTRHITKEGSEWSMFDALRNSGRGWVSEGAIKVLYRGKTVVMSNTRDEMSDHSEFVYTAHGNILIMGLGLGMALAELLDKDDVQSVTVVEKSQDVIDLVGWFFMTDKRVRIVKGDAFEWKPENETFDYVWHDIWDTISADNVEEMKKLHRKFGRVSGWQGSWCRRECERLRKEEREYQKEQEWFDSMFGGYKKLMGECKGIINEI